MFRYLLAEYCSSNKCHKRANFIAIWNGKETVKCEDCADKMTSIGQAMGVEVPVYPYEPVNPEE